jgi:hypothetical protein
MDKSCNHKELVSWNWVKSTSNAQLSSGMVSSHVVSRVKETLLSFFILDDLLKGCHLFSPSAADEEEEVIGKTHGAKVLMKCKSSIRYECRA